MRHELKTDPDAFDAVIEGTKTFEIRKNDRNFRVGDELTLRKTMYTGAEMASGKPLQYTGDFWTVSVTHVLPGPIYGLQEGWCIMAIAPLRDKNMKFGGVQLILEERCRQIRQEGYNAPHDDRHTDGESV